MKGDRDGIDVEIALQWNDGYSEAVYAFANNINTHEGGTHLSGFRSALTRTINFYAGKNSLAKDLKESISGDDIREGLTAVISVKIPRPQFEGQTKTKLGNTEVKGIVEAIVNDKLGSFLEENPAIAKRILEQGRRRGARAGSGAQSARPRAPQGRAGGRRPAGQARRLPGARPGAERALHRRRRIGRRVRQAGPRPAVPGDPADQGQDPERREGALRQDARQRGNPHDDLRARLRHRRARNSTSAKLRYHRIIIMTDADVDGSHIRTLLLTFFYRQMPELINNGYIYIAQPPLFRAKRGKGETYIKDERELESYLIRRSAESRSVQAQRQGNLRSGARTAAPSADDISQISAARGAPRPRARGHRGAARG